MSKSLREARKAAMLTQQQVADVFQIKREAVSLWESGGAKGTKPDIRKLERLAALYNKPISELLGGERLPEEGDAEDERTQPTLIAGKTTKELSKEQEFVVSLIDRMDKETRAAFIALFEKLLPDRRKENLGHTPGRRLDDRNYDAGPDLSKTHDQPQESKQLKRRKNR